MRERHTGKPNARMIGNVKGILERHLKDHYPNVTIPESVVISMCRSVCVAVVEGIRKAKKKVYEPIFEQFPGDSLKQAEALVSALYVAPKRALPPAPPVEEPVFDYDDTGTAVAYTIGGVRKEIPRGTKGQRGLFPAHLQ